MAEVMKRTCDYPGCDSTKDVKSVHIQVSVDDPAVVVIDATIDLCSKHRGRALKRAERMYSKPAKAVKPAPRAK